MEISSLFMEIMRDRKWNFPPCFCMIREGRKITFWGVFFLGDEKKCENGEGIWYRRKEMDF